MDEFSDFQMAIQKPPSSNIANGRLPYYGSANASQLGPISPHFPDSSPLHVHSSPSAHSTFSMKSDSIHHRHHHFNHHNHHGPQVIAPLKPVAPPTSVGKAGPNIGSRLANYDLGLSVTIPPQTTQSTSNYQGASGITSIRFSAPMINSQLKSNKSQDLLIGEEDKYSALRILLESESNNSNSVFETAPTTSSRVDTKPECLERPFDILSSSFNADTKITNSVVVVSSSSSHIPVNHLTYLIANSRPMFNGDSAFESCTDNSKTLNQSSGGGSGADSSSDFGDFQSFTGYSTTDSFTTNCKNNQTLVTPAPFPISEPPNFTSATNSISNGSREQPPFQEGFVSGSFDSHVTLNTGNSFKDCDSEFGDFVSVEPIPAVASTSVTPLSNNVDSQNYLKLLTSSPPPQLNLQPLSSSSFPSEYNSNYSAFQEGVFNDNQCLNQSHLLPLKSSSQKPSNIPISPFNTLDNDDFSDFSKSCEIAITEQNVTISKGISNPPQEEINNSLETNDLNNLAPLGIGSDSLKSHQQKYSQQNCTVPPSSTFIRTSLIRNDEVTDIDSIRWTKSVEKSSCNSSNQESVLDYISYERAKEDEGKANKFLDVSPETRSIASLDLGNYVSVDCADNTATILSNNNNSKPLFPEQSAMQQNSNQPSEKCSLSLTLHAPYNYLSEEDGTRNNEDGALYQDDFDKYQYLRDEWESERERYFTEWDRCLNACKLVISKAITIFKGASNSEVVGEVVDNEKGYSYVMNVLEVYHLFLRIHKSSLRMGLDGKFRNGILEINNLWESLTTILIGTSVSDELCQDRNFDLDECTLVSEEGARCGVCVCPVDISQRSHYLDYGGKMYHCSCANFWVNEVDAILPSLLSYLPSIENHSSAGNSS